MISGIAKSRGKKALAANGRYVSIDDSYKETAENLCFIKELVEADELKAVIDRSYPLAEMVEAHRYVETGRKKGNVVITVAHSDEPVAIASRVVDKAAPP